MNAGAWGFRRQVMPCPWRCRGVLSWSRRGWRGILSNLPLGLSSLWGAGRQVFQDGELALRPRVSILVA